MCVSFFSKGKAENEAFDVGKGPKYNNNKKKKNPHSAQVSNKLSLKKHTQWGKTTNLHNN